MKARRFVAGVAASLIVVASWALGGPGLTAGVQLLKVKTSTPKPAESHRVTRLVASRSTAYCQGGDGRSYRVGSVWTAPDLLNTGASAQVCERDGSWRSESRRP
jgi:hypothetical protein